MNLIELAAWQWEGYSKFHRLRLNLIIHIISVPLFIVAVLSLAFLILRLSFAGSSISVAIILISFGAQGIGHSMEKMSAEPFSSPQQALVRILLEQFFTFPKFVISGGWYAAFSSGETNS